MVSGLPSDTTIDESSELSELSVQGPLGLFDSAESVDIGDSQEWEDLD
jgi:hypothetical protein